MEIIELIVLSLALAMDASAVSMSDGICYPRLSKKKALFITATFAIFQGLMPLIGYFFGLIIASFIDLVGNWFAFIVLTIIGINMIVEAIKEKKHPEVCLDRGHLSIKEIMIQGLATSIDALVVGITLTAFETPIQYSVLIISVITFGCCTLGIVIGKKFGSILKDKAPILGGFLLMAIALKFLIEIFI